MRRSSGQNQGFTLLELLVAFSLVLLLAVLLFDGLRFGQRVWAVSDKNLTSQDDTVLVRGLLVDWVGNIYPAFVKGKEVLDFQGKNNRLQFIAPLGVNPDAKQLYRIVLNFDREGNTLTASWSDLSLRQSFERVLLEEVEAVEFSYFGSLEEYPAPRWHASWEGGKNLPGLVKITLRFAETKETAWPDLIIKPNIDWGINCQFDPTSGVCRKGAS